MIDEDRANTLLRENVLEVLSDDEVARVSTAESGPRLDEGDEFVDPAHLQNGVLQADGVEISMGEVLPKKSVQEKTWNSILAFLNEHLFRAIDVAPTAPSPPPR